jgi:hypothetical protein
MSTGMIILMVIFVAACILPFYMAIRSKKQVEMKMLKALGRLSRSKNSAITQYDICAHAGIAIDENTGYVFFCRLTENTVVEDSINLNEVTQCVEVNKGRVVGEGKNKYHVTTREGVVFHTKSKDQPLVNWDFFNEDTASDFNLAGELQLVSKWVKIINLHLSKTNKRALVNA